MNIKLSKIASLLSLDLIGTDTNIYNLSIDSREVNKGDFFVAIEGMKFDGHDYIQESISNGACAILCNDRFDVSKINVPYPRVRENSVGLVNPPLMDRARRSYIWCFCIQRKHPEDE